MCPPYCSHDSDFVGNIKSVLVAGEGDVSLLLTSWGDEGVNLLDLDAVKLGAGLLDHDLGGSLVNDEYKGVAVFDGLDGRFRAEWVLDHGEFIESNDWLNSFQKNLWYSLLGVSSWSFEGSFVPNLGFLGGVSSLLHGG